MNPDIFKYATAVRDSVTKEQQAYIEEAYKKWSEDVLEQAEYYSKLTTGSSPVSQAYYQQLYQQMQAQSKEIANGVYTNITNGMAQVSDAVVKDAVDWMSGFGFSKKGLDAAFSYIPQSTVNSLITGSVYGKPGSWSLSAAIWVDNEKTLRDIYSIMGQGIAAQMPIEDIAKKLSQYVDPNKQLSWTGPNGMRIYKHAVDYNAQRLARTLVQHTYQQSFVAATKDNPFVTDYVWIANGSRVCPICADRDGTHYKKDKLPLDHPNGMCTMEPVVDDKMVDKLANWVNSEDGTYPEIDAFASKFDYDATKLPKMTLADIKKQYGNSHYKSPSAWYKNLPKDVQQTVSQIHQASGKKWTQWYQDEMMDQSLKTTVKKVTTTAAKQADDSADDILKLAAKYEKQMSKASKDFMYMGKMSKRNMLDDLFDDEIDDLAEFAAKKYGMPIKTGSQKDKAIMRLFDDMFDEVDKLKFNGNEAVADQLQKIVTSGLDDDIAKFVSKYGKPSNVDDITSWMFSTGKVTEISQELVDIAKTYDKTLEEITNKIKSVKKSTAGKTTTIKASAKTVKKKATFETEFDDWLIKNEISVTSNMTKSQAVDLLDDIMDNEDMYISLHDLFKKYDLVKGDDIKYSEFSNKVLEFAKNRSGKDESWLDKIKNVTMKQMKDEERYIRGKLPAAVERGMKRYSSSSGCASMNHIARTAYHKNISVVDFCEDIISGKVSGFNEKDAKILSDMVKAYNSVRTYEDKILRRGASLGDLAGNFMNGNFDDNLAELRKMSVDELRDKFVGVIGQYNAPISASSMWNNGFDGEVEVIFDAPKGTHGASILDISVFGDAEGEFQLKPETRCIITDIQKSDGHKGSKIRVFMKILVD